MSRVIENRQKQKPGLSTDALWPKSDNPEFFFSLQSYLWLPRGSRLFLFEVVGLELMCAFNFLVPTHIGDTLACSWVCLSGARSGWLLFLLSACFLDLMSHSLSYSSGKLSVPLWSSRRHRAGPLEFLLLPGVMPVLMITDVRPRSRYETELNICCLGTTQLERPK